MSRTVPSAAVHDFASWRSAARTLLASNVDPAAVSWSDDQATDLFAPPPTNDPPVHSPANVAANAPNVDRPGVPRALLALLGDLACHRDDGRWALMYRLLWRVTHGERHLLADAADPDVATAQRMAQAVRRDAHKMKAFVRFRNAAAPGEPEQFVAWFEPQHRILRQALDQCRRCELWRDATQAVDGEGPNNAPLMLVGEQPGDEEDLRGSPFVGPAGRLLDQALQAAGLERRDIYVTNAVKHFKWEPRGKRRLHKKPNAQEVTACNYWLIRELTAVRPKLIVALGTTALSALIGPGMTLREARSRELRHANGVQILATYHPSAVLRAPPELREEMMHDLIADLRKAAQHVED